MWNITKNDIIEIEIFDSEDTNADNNKKDKKNRDLLITNLYLHIIVINIYIRKNKMQFIA